MKKIIILILLLVSVLGCIEQKTGQPSPIVTTAPKITDTVSKEAVTSSTPQTTDTIPEATASSTPQTDNTAPADNTIPRVTTIVSPEPTQNVTNNNTEEDSPADNSLDNETDYDVNEPPDEESECYDANGTDIPCPPDNSTTN